MITHQTYLSQTHDIMCQNISGSTVSPPKWPSTSLFDDFFIWQTRRGFKTKYPNRWSLIIV